MPVDLVLWGPPCLSCVFIRWRAELRKANSLQPFGKCTNPLSESLVDLLISQKLPILIPSSLGLRSLLWLFSDIFSPKQSWWYIDPSACLGHGAREIRRSYIFTPYIPYIVMCIEGSLGYMTVNKTKQQNRLPAVFFLFFLSPLVEPRHSSQFFSFSCFYSTELDNWWTILWTGK